MASTPSRSYLQNSAQASTSTTSLSSETPITTTTSTQPVLHLRGADREARRTRIQWAEDVVDNEGLGRKKSKVCCIYHAPKGIDESSDESSSDSSSDESGNDDGGARPSGSGRGRGDGHGHKGHGCGKDGKDSKKGKERKRSPNAYEKMPKNRTGGGGQLKR
ncbi:type 1 phosphatases regulator ypi-1 [Halenospora varia]|nr:type 1 phosphatases regulator ypi-1 [Halenospora varia]